MARHSDFQFESSDYGKCKQYQDDDALILSIKNILLSKPGNFPFHPNLGMNIKKYQFDILDDITLRKIETELKQSIATYMPSLNGINVNVLSINKNGQNYLCISVDVNVSDKAYTVNFLLTQDTETHEVSIFNETI